MPAPRVDATRAREFAGGRLASLSPRTIYINSSGRVRYNANNRNMLYTKRWTGDKEKKNTSI